MAATITEQLRLPGGHNPPLAFVTLQLVGTGSAPVEGFVGGQSIVSSYTVKLGVGDAGFWSIAGVELNSAITPSGTRWQRTVKIDRVVVATDYLNVTTSATLRVDQVLALAPGPVAPPGAIPSAIGTGKGSLIGFSAAGVPVEIPAGPNGYTLIYDITSATGLTASPGGGGGGGSIISVNGQVGPTVVLAASDVGAATPASVTSAVAAEATLRTNADALLIPLTQKAAANGVASLDSSGLIPQAQLPAIALQEFLGAVASQSAMLALVGQRGDWCTRTDRGTDFQLIAEPSSVLGNWRERTYPASPVLTVNGRAGAVTGLAEQTSLDTEATTRGTADTTLQTNITAEATARNTQVTARSLIPTATVTGNTTANPGDLVMVDATSGPVTVTAPTLAAGVRWGIRLVTASTNQVTASTGAGTFDTNGTTTLPMATGFALVDVTFAANAAATQWVAVTSGKPNAYLQSLMLPNLPPTTVKTATFAAAANTLVRVDSSGGVVNPITLPTTPANLSLVVVKQVGASVNLTTIAAGGTATFSRIGGSATTTQAVAGQSTVFQYYAADNIWLILANDLPVSMIAKPNHGSAIAYDSSLGSLTLGARQVNDDQFNAALSRWHVAAADATNAPVKIMFIGDSELEFVNSHRAAVLRLSALLSPADRLLSGKTASGTSYPGSQINGVGGSIPIWTQTGGVTQAQVQATRGMAGCAIQLTNGQTVTLPATQLEQVTFNWLAGNGGSTLDLQIDGVNVATGVAANVAGTFTTAALKPTAAGHTVTIVSHGTTLFDSVQLYFGNATVGLQPFQASKTGVTTASINGWTDLPGYLTSINPDLVVLESGINDYESTGLTYYNAMSTLIDTVRAAHADTSIVLWLPHETQGHAPWAIMRQMARKLATVKNVALADAAEVIPSMGAGSWPTNDPYSLTLDGVHYSAKGAVLFSSVLVAAIAGSWQTPYQGVDTMGARAAQASLWRGVTRSGSSIPTLSLADTGGGFHHKFFLNDGDTYPAMDVGSLPLGFLSSYVGFGPGGSLGIDVYAMRSSANKMGINAVDASTPPAPGGVVYNFPMVLASVAADVASTATTAEQDLYNVAAVPINLLTANGDAIEYTLFGTFGNNARTKQLKTYFAGQASSDTGTVTFAGSATDSWEIRALIVRQSATTVKTTLNVFINGGSAVVRPNPGQLTVASVVTNTSAIRLTATVGAGAAASDVILRGGKIMFLPA